MKPAWRRHARWALLRSQRSRTVARFCRSASAAAASKLAERLVRLPGVRAVLLRHTSPESPSFVLGHSDLDLTLLLDDATAEDPSRVAACAAVMEDVARGHVLVEAQDVRFTSRAELDRLGRMLPAPVELLYGMDDWQALAGEAPRLPPAAPYPARLLLLHPEFNKWWDNMLQLQVLEPSPDQGRGYVRALFRCALKSHLILEWAETGGVDPAAVLHEDLTRVDFTRNVELGEILRELQRDVFWTRDDTLAARVLRLTLDAVTGFYERRPPAGPSAPLAGEAVASAPHGRVAQAIGPRVSAAASRLPGLRSAVAYPLPNAGSGRYRLDLVLADRLPPADVARLVDRVRSVFGGRAFDVADGHVELKLVPWTAYTNPLYWQGTPGPFLPEHVQAHGWVVQGAMPMLPRAPRERGDALTWIAAYLPFHMFNLRRRLGASSHGLNFNQLASLRLYLEHDEIVTDGADVRDRYLERFGGGGEDRDVLRRLLERFGGSPPPEAREFQRLSEEYDALEAAVTADARGTDGHRGSSAPPQYCAKPSSG